ncbi:25377_t:CDS:2 [Racocetra persica]|uniref:25377_t:CDS:1 n=1 Tax=Racocetra persica TaxID=160502 RepID=A0ACA9L4G2_9GLOM|nr:25377_t:CDS:2 [Racocetra persica]
MSYETNSSLTSDIRDHPGFYIIIPAGLIAGCMNGICSAYLIIRILCRWWVTDRSLSMAHRVPFYMSIAAVNGQTLQGVGCKVAGGITFFFVAFNVTLVGSLSLTTYLRICRKLIINFGRYDYKLFSFIILISLTLTLIGVHDYGPNKFWCYSAPTDPITPLVTLISNKKNIRQLGSDAVKFNRIDLIVVRKIIGYILIFLIEWIPTIVYFIAQMVQYDNIWIYTVAVVTINFGGLGNMILYIGHESWTNKYDSSDNSGSIRNTNESGAFILNSSSKSSNNNQELYPQITVHNTITIEKENFASSSSTLGLPTQERN